MRNDTDKWCLYILICAIVSYIVVFVGKFSFGVVGENITLRMRHLLYSSIVKKHMGWFDNRDNASGIITSVLASDV